MHEDMTPLPVVGGVETGEAFVEGLLLSGEEPRLPLESCLSSSVQYGGHEGGAGSPAW